MGESSAATVREIEDLRGRIESNVRELERRMPQPAVWGKRLVGVAVGSGVTAFALRSVLKRARKRRAARKAVERTVPVAVQPVVQVVPDDVADRIASAFEDGRWKQWAAVGAGVWVALRLLELRQLRRVNRSVMAGSAT